MWNSAMRCPEARRSPVGVSVVWIPVLLVGSMLYWTLALGFGGLSLMSLTAEMAPCSEISDLVDESESNSEDGRKAGARDSFQSITVNLADPVDSSAAAGGSVTVDLVSDQEAPSEDSGRAESGRTGDPDQRGSGRRSRFDQGPGETAF